MPDQTTALPDTFSYSEQQAGIARVLAKDLFFIGAYPKSGTTWLQVMLNAHPEIICRGEGHLLDRFAPLLEGAVNTQNNFIRQKNTTVFRGLPPFPRFEEQHLLFLLVSAIALILGRSDDRRDVRVIGEKTPDNLRYFPLLGRLFPTAKFLHVVRDGRDCAVSAWFHNLRVNAKELHRRHGTFDRFSEDTARRWTPWVEGGLRFCAARPERCMTVRYEDMVERGDDTMRAVLGFLGVEASADVVRRCIAAGAFEAMSGGRQRGIEDRGSFTRLGLPGNWRDHLTAESNGVFQAIAGEMLTRLGYQG